ncbi:DUF1302 family protein [Nitrosovibrio tenuis]|uniref:Alginate export domain-containing protein n=1 Tax=Nitrosovibrio tenuis TaxID=1233 RepID=A0A1H7PQM6_9PROT|nr:DUF1302 family protein [Nitrosovibrio tenuis]SEL37347.1 hypothetical protein SAMN05216387_10991 [Nitrosovibrio tenuis]
MEHRRKLFGYVVFITASIVLPARSLAETAASSYAAVAIPASSSLLPNNTDEQPLFLSLSLSLAPLSARKVVELTGKSNPAALDEAEDESLLMPLSLSLSLLSTRSLINGNKDNAAQNKDDDEIEREAGFRESLFGSIEPAAEVSPSTPIWKQLVTGWRGFSQLELADNYSSPEHFSKAKLRTELSRTGQFNEHIKWKISGRFDYDAAYDLSNFYPEAVRQNQRAQFFVRENYLDVSAGNFDFRLGRQHVVWGEMVGLFFADVVSAKDLREFILPAFDILRIPQWAIRAEYSKNDTHAEVLWIPVPTLDEIGKPGADFYPGPLRGTASFLGEDRSGRNIGNSNYGFRLSQLKNGWDMTAFYYHSLDASSTFYRVSGPADPLVFQPRHDKIDQAGGTVTKDFGSIVFKGELVYTDGRSFNVARPSAVNGLVKQNTLDYALGLDFSLPAETRLNLQFFQRVFFAHDRDSFSDAVESGGSILLVGKVWRKLEAQTLLIHSLNHSDWMFRPRLSWNFERNWRWAVGADIFGGKPTGLFGRFDHNDRVYTELRYSF